MTCQITLRSTSAAATSGAPSPQGTATVRYGSDSLRKYTGPKYVRPIRVFTKRGSCERSRRLPTSFGAKRDTSSCTLPVASSWTSSVMAGTSRSRRRKSISRCSRASAGSVKGTSIGARDGKVPRSRPTEDLRHEARGLDALRAVVRAVGDEPSVAHPELGGKRRGDTTGQGGLEQHGRDVHGGDVRHEEGVARAQALDDLIEIGRRADDPRHDLD